ncbi:MAG: class C beta-lactamase-related serine hydrolase [Bacteroidia bacterium]|nr:MAG: class C beta-lactamase-related serine hydrolase [Bacteroidia bacterium]
MIRTPARLTLKKVATGILLLLVVIIIGASVYLNSLLPIITVYAAKNLCSAVFVSGREQAEVESSDLNFSFISYTKNRVDNADMSVRSRFLWGRSKAIYRDGFGVTLVRGTDEKSLRDFRFPGGIEAAYNRDTVKWPMGDIISDTITGIDIAKLESVTGRLIGEDGYGGNAYAFMVIYKGIPVAEAYKPQFTEATPFLSWSMAKSITNALVGIMVREDGLDISSTALLPQWVDDGRSNISLNDLMHMQSGLEWNEDYGNRSDVTVMLHCEDDFAEFAYTQDLAYDPGIHWYYSSGNINIVSYFIRQQFDNDNDYYEFPYAKLFHRIGITDAVFEPDASGTFVASSYLYMTARDYARFALLYLQDGIFNNERILPEGWVDYSVTPASASNNGYGSLFWLNRAGEIPSAPEDMYMCIGHDGQRIFIVPSHDLAVVVLGYSPNGSMDFNSLVGDILQTLPE